jgi:hypothetical protein
MSGHANSLRAILLALGANFAIFLSKLVAALLTGSSAMLAEAVHSLADCGNQGLLLLGMRQADRPPSEEYPLGWGRALYFWSFLVAMLLFSVGGMFSIYEGIHKLSNPEPLRWPWLAIGVLGFGVVAESFSMHGCLKEVNKVREGRSLWRWFHETRSSELLVIFGEDLAALFGRHHRDRRAAGGRCGGRSDRGESTADRSRCGAKEARSVDRFHQRSPRSGCGT